MVQSKIVGVTNAVEKRGLARVSAMNGGASSPGDNAAHHSPSQRILCQVVDILYPPDESCPELVAANERNRRRSSDQERVCVVPPSKRR